MIIFYLRDEPTNKIKYRWQIENMTDDTFSEVIGELRDTDQTDGIWNLERKYGTLDFSGSQENGIWWMGFFSSEVTDWKGLAKEFEQIFARLGYETRKLK